MPKKSGLTESEREKVVEEHMVEIDSFIEKQKNQTKSKAAKTVQQKNKKDDDKENVPALGNGKRGRRGVNGPNKKPKAPLKREKEFDIKVAVAAEVRKNPALYQLTHKGNKDVHLKESLWKTVSENVSLKIGEDKLPQECKDIWKALRESCR